MVWGLSFLVVDRIREKATWILFVTFSSSCGNSSLSNDTIGVAAFAGVRFYLQVSMTN